jgi:hypothetical protein
LALRFRPTVWPGSPVPVPRVLAIREVRRDGAWLLLLPSQRYEYVEVPPEVYLRQFRDTPLDDLDALAELCKLGLIRPLSPAPPYSDLPIHSDALWARSLAVLTAPLWSGHAHWYGDEKQREEVEERHRRDLIPVHAAEVALRVRIMQRATNHLLAHLDGKPLAPAWHAPPWRDCKDDLDAWGNFIRSTGAALREFHVRVDVETVGQSPRADDLQVGEVETTLYSAGMLQLVNDLAANETVRHCANEACGRPYVRQLGRSTYGGHRRSGTLYCSNTCARAQYQREKRRRDRAAKGGTAR